MAKIAQCSERSITNIRKNFRLFSSARPPPVSVGREPSIVPIILDALCDHIAQGPHHLCVWGHILRIQRRDRYGFRPRHRSCQLCYWSRPNDPAHGRKPLGSSGWCRQICCKWVFHAFPPKVQGTDYGCVKAIFLSLELLLAVSTLICSIKVVKAVPPGLETRNWTRLQVGGMRDGY